MKPYEIRDIQLKLCKKDREMARMLGVSLSGYKNMKCGTTPVIPLYIEKSLYAHLQLWIIQNQTGMKFAALSC